MSETRAARTELLKVLAGGVVEPLIAEVVPFDQIST